MSNSSVPSRFVGLFIQFKLRQPRDKTGDAPGRHRLARCGSPKSNGRSLIDLGSYIEQAPPREDVVPRPVVGCGAYIEPALPGEDRISPSV